MSPQANLVDRSRDLRRSSIRWSSLLVVVVAIFTQSTTSQAESLNVGGAKSTQQSKRTAAQMAAWIDDQFQEAWASQRIAPAPGSTDSEFVRRVYLDLIGRIPSVAEVRDFLENDRINKRQILIEELLQRGAFASHLANTWRELLLAGNTAVDSRDRAPALETWLKLRFSANMPYDQLATELLTATLDQNNPRIPSPLAFYQATEFKPETLAASVSRVFLGVQVQCAQCHDHPFAAWKQQQFWSFAALFKSLDPQRATMMVQDNASASDEIQIPGKELIVPALFLDGSQPDRSTSSDRRIVLARWITGPENPLFAKAVVNRVWGNFFGRGFVQPIDDLDPANAPVHGQVFDELCAQFRLHGCDLKYLVRVITATKAYQLSSRGASIGSDDGNCSQFARMPLRRMTSDQVYASLVQATGYREVVANRNVGIVTGGARDEFLAKFGDSALSPTEIETTILQALALMNGQFVANATDVENSEFLSAVADSPFFDEQSRMITLFLATLSRPPRSEELELFAGPGNSTDAKTRKAALADLFWTLLNSAEFLLNH